MQDILYKQWEKILKMEKTIMELVSKSKFKSAKRHLKSSLITLNGMISNVFSTNDNIFKYFVSSMRPRIKLLIKEAKMENDYVKKNNERVLPKRTNAEKFHNETKKQRLKRKRKKSLKTYENGSNQTSDFSSDDNLCLKDAIKRIKKDSSSGECESVKMESQDNCIKKITYYVVPEKKDKKALSVLEKDQIRVALKHILKKKFVDLNLFDGFVLKRFELELDEVVPDDAIIVTEWLFDDSEKKDWDSTSFADFLSKNVSKKHKTSNSEFDCENGSSSSKGTDRNFECDVCNSKFSTNNFLKVHMINIHHTSDFSCDTCGEIFLNKGKLFQHNLQHHSYLECEVCLVKCNSAEEKEKHFLSHEPDGWYCGICSENFLLAEDLKYHHRTIHRDKNIGEKIGEDKTSMKAIKFDKKSDHAPKCDRCFRRFTSIGRLTQHIAIVHEGKIFRKDKQKIDESVVSEQSSS